MLDTNYLFQNLCTFFFLKEEVKKCNPYDGFSADEQTELYINSNGFNPIIKFKEHTDMLLKDLYINDFSLIIDKINSLNEFTLLQANIDCELFSKIISSSKLPHLKLIENLFIDLYFMKGRSLFDNN